MTRSAFRSLAFVLALAASLCGQRIKAVNQSAETSDQWIRVSVPNTGSNPRHATFAGGPAVKLYSRKGATFYAVRPSIDGGSSVTSELELTEVEHEFTEHPAVFGNLFEVQPRLYIDGAPVALRAIRLVESNAARRVFEFRFAEPGWTGRAWVYCYSGQDVAGFTALASWTDRKDGRWFRPTRSIEWRFGEHIHAPTALAEGWEIRSDWQGPRILRWNVPETKEGKVIGDSEVYRFSGSLLCAERNRWSQSITQATAPARSSAVCLDWAGEWGPFEATAPLPTNAQALADAEAQEFDAILSNPGSMLRLRPYGHKHRAGNAGHQPVFGHTLAGVATSLGDPRQIERLLFSVQDDFLRPEHLRDEWGNVLRIPELSTWNMRPHWSRRRDGERTKPTEEWPPSYSLGDDRTDGRTGRDNEHWASMVPAAYLLTGDYDLDWIMRGWASVLPTNNNVWNTDSRLVDRGLGRLLRLLAWMELSLDGTAQKDARGAMVALIDRADDLITKTGDIRHVGVLTVGDARGIKDEAGNARTTMNSPFQSIAACGLWAAANVLPDGHASKPKALGLALDVAESLVTDAFYFEDGRAWSPYHLHYRDGGARIPDAERLSGSWEVKGGASDGGTDWLAGWAAGVLPLVMEHGSTADVRARAARMLESIPKPRTFFDARFWGTVQR